MIPNRCSMPRAVELGIRATIATTLVIAAALKFYGVVTGVLTVASLNVPVWVITLTAYLEIFVAWQLCFSSHSALTWGAAVVLFAVFSSVSLVRWVSGASSCGCFGLLDTPPVATLAMTTACLVLLALVAPLQAAVSVRHDIASWSIQVIHHRRWVRDLAHLATVALMTGFLSTPAGRALAKLPSITRIVASSISIDQGCPESRAYASIAISNTSDHAAHIIGVNSTCGCITLGKAPDTIPPRGTIWYPVSIVRPMSTGEFHKVVSFYFDHPEQYVAQSKVSGQVIGESVQSP